MAEHSRTKERRAKKKAKRNGVLIPGVPAFWHGGVVGNIVPYANEAQHQAANPNPQGSTQPQLEPTQFPGILWDPVGQQFVSEPGFSPSSPGGGGGGSAAPQFRPGELELLQAQGQREQQQIELNQLIQQQQNAIARGELQLAKQIETRIAAMEQRQFKLDQFIQQRSQQIEQTLGGAQGLAGIGRDLGNIEATRAQFLSNLAANPRDFEQLQIALGGGSSFLDAISQGQRPEGQGINRAQENLPLGQGFLDLLSAVTARPDLGFFDQAGDAFSALLPAQLTPEGFSGVPRQFARGGKMVTDEPIVGVGLRSGKQRFTLGEPTPEFPQGAPEELNITPLTGGGGEPARGIGPTGGTALTPPVAPPSLADVQVGFGQTSFIGDFLRAQQGTRTGQPVGTVPGPAPAPLTPGQQVAKIMSSLQPIDFFSMLPSARANLESRISSLGFPPEDIFAEFLRSLATGANPNAISFGNFSKGGTVSVRPAA